MATPSDRREPLNEQKSPRFFRQIDAPLEVPDEALNALGDRLGVPTIGQA